MRKTCFFTIVSNNYRHFARTLVASVRAHDPEADAFVAICDGSGFPADPRDAFTEIAMRELGLPQFDRFTFQYTILELNTAIKPWVFAALFARGYERVIYFDPDIKLFGSIAPVLARLDDAQIVVTPHLTGPLDDGRHPTELSILQSGSYNLGFIALRRTQETQRFVAWWQGKLLRECIVDIPRGLFTDQKWIDLVPGMFEGVAIERDPGWNLAYWNLNHRAVSDGGDGGVRVDGRPLLFFHFSGFTPGAKSFSKHQDRFTMDNLPAQVRSLADGYAADLLRNGFEACRASPYAFARFPDGTPIPDVVRRCYREDFPWDAPHPDLWTPLGQAFVTDWLNTPAPEHARSPWLTRLAAKLYGLRPDLQAAFPDVTGKQGRAFAHWLVEHAAEQERFPGAMIAPVRAALEGRASPARLLASAGTAASAVNPSATDAVDAPRSTAQIEAGAPEGTARGMFRAVYRAAWNVRGLVKPLTSQAFRHRVRHALLRKAYFDDSYATPPLVAASGAIVGKADRPAHAYPAHAADAATDADTGINVIGYLTAESGVGEGARSMLRILGAADIPVSTIDFRVGNLSRMDERVPEVSATAHLHAINLFHINADQMFVAHNGLGKSLFDGRYNIGWWAWELREFPEAWVPAFSLLDEVWVPSTFCQQAIAQKSPVPVICVPCSVAAPAVTPDRSRFGIAPDDIAYFAMCDVLSVPERKNPLGVVEAFRAAFPAGDKVRLLLKIGNIEFQPDIKAKLDQALRADPRITLIEGYLSRAQLWTLMASVDAFVSLHRSEGFGFGMAEAMACGTAVIATGWSGNVDFTRPGNALLVDYTLTELTRDLGPYRRGQVWAEPDIAMAASLMRKLAQSATLRQSLRERGQATVAQELSPGALAPLVQTRLAAIRSMLADGWRARPRRAAISAQP